jgi:hypothetical protein
MSRISRVTRTSIFSFGLALLLVGAAATIPWTYEQSRAATDPEVSIEQFGRYLEQWSEPEGYFDSDNFISNETSYLHVVDQLQKQIKPGGVYLGVGPDQNFSYIVHTKPVLAIITDIRRQNMLEHLWYKALFAMASSRLEFLALLTSREVPRANTGSSLEQIIQAVEESRTSEDLFRKNNAAIKSLLVDKYRLKLSPADLSKIEYVYRTFWHDGLELRFSSIGRNNALNYPTLEEMLLETDRQGRQQSYLSSEELFQQLKKFEAENRLIPIVGDFAGPRAFKTVGAFLKANGQHVSTFYTSNVEFYLFSSSDWRYLLSSSNWARFVGNVRSLPFSNDALFIRSYFGNGRPHPLNMRGHRSTSLVKPVGPFLADYDAGKIAEYWDIVKP